MNFYDSLIHDVKCTVDLASGREYGYEPKKAWEDIGYNQVIMQRDSMFELDGIGFNPVTSNPIDDGIVVVGDDLCDIQSDRKFARISLIEIDDVADEQTAYNLIRKIEYVKYHHFPNGYMIRTSSKSQKETVRVSKAAIKYGISFERIGDLLIKKYKENPAVKGVKVIFITDKNADFKQLEAIAQKNHDITEALNHVMNHVNFDCDTCKLKPVCDEVEGMKELHFKNSSKM